MMQSKLQILSGGAAQGLVEKVREDFLAASGCTIEGTFGAVGVMRDRLIGGAACDVLILTDALVAQLTRDGHLSAASVRPLGTVKTGLAVKSGTPLPAITNAAQLKTALLSAQGIYLPDPVKATAGIHFMNVLQQLGVADALAARLRPFPNGTTAMREMAAAEESNVIGCTQVTEILHTPGVQLAGRLPGEFELATVYTAAVCTRAQQPERATQLVALLAAAETAAARRAVGFES
jgi:molybdate transport system substrate-binding protein